MSSRRQLKITSNWIDRAIGVVAPSTALRRVKARTLLTSLRSYEAAGTGRRTSGWHRGGSDANAANGPALSVLREQARDLVRNNSWAAEGLRVVVDNTVGWGIQAKASAAADKTLTERWRRWSETTECDADGRLSFAGLQALTMRTVVESGEALVRARGRRPEDGLSIPLQLQVLEPDFIDTAKDLQQGPSGGPIIQGVEYDLLGRRVAYWLFEQHPGSNRAGGLRSSRRIPADRVAHVFFVQRPGQVRGVTWFSAVIANLRDFDEYEDASLMQAKVAALFAAVITDDGQGSTIGEPSAEDLRIDTLEPGMIIRTPPGGDAKFGVPPVASDNGFSTRTLRRIAAGLGATHEDVTGDYSQVNYSSGRMGRNKHNAHVHQWRWNMLVPQLCMPVWSWAMEAASLRTGVDQPIWTPPPAGMIDPDKEGLALMRQVRAGMMTFSEMVREQGGDPEEHFDEYATDLARLDKLGIKLDSDVRAVSQAGLTQERVGGGGDKKAES